MYECTYKYQCTSLYAFAIRGDLSDDPEPDGSHCSPVAESERTGLRTQLRAIADEGPLLLTRGTRRTCFLTHAEELSTKLMQTNIQAIGCSQAQNFLDMPCSLRLSSHSPR